jgi:hypothetical protein
MSNVFKRKGPNFKSYDVNVRMHAYQFFGVIWDDAGYNTGTGNIYVGDGPNRQALDALAHENGHGLNDFTAKLGVTGESGGLNESNSDIWGAMSTFYLKGGPVGGAFANHSTTIPNDKGIWTLVGSGRNMQKPSKSKQPDYWFPAIGSLDPHDAAGPNNRAFYFLSQGSSMYLKMDNYSTLLPWGMKGIGNQKAAQLWYDAFTGWMTSDSDYNDTLASMIAAAATRYGSASNEYDSVVNAWAGVNVGYTSGKYGAAVPVTMEVEPNNTKAQAMPLPGFGLAPAGAPDKNNIFGGGYSEDWYSIDLAQGEELTVRLEPFPGDDYDLHVYNPSQSLVASSLKGVGVVDQVFYTAPAAGKYYIKVSFFSATSVFNSYRMWTDNFMPAP